jgi:hypothetical protein
LISSTAIQELQGWFNIKIVPIEYPLLEHEPVQIIEEFGALRNQKSVLGRREMPLKMLTAIVAVEWHHTCPYPINYFY